MKDHHFEKSCCGTTHVGERGQVVIPADARKKMNLKSGDKLITFVKNDKALIMVKAENIEKLAAKMAEHTEKLKRAIKK